MRPEDRNQDERLSRMLAAVRAEADPALWNRARARIASRKPTPLALIWITRPAALAAAAGLLVLACGVSWRLLAPTSTLPSTSTAGLVERLEAERGDSGNLDNNAWPGSASPRDSGAGS